MSLKLSATAASFCELMGCRYPIIQAPMAGGPSTPAMAIAAIKAGCIGSIAATGLTPAALRTAIRTVYAECGGRQVPLMVNVQLPPPEFQLVPNWSEPLWAVRFSNALQYELALTSTVSDLLEGKLDDVLSKSTSPSDLHDVLVCQARRLHEIQSRPQVSQETVDPSWRQQIANSYADWVKMVDGVVEVVLEEKPKAFSWVFGVTPGDEVLQKMKEKNILLVGAATTGQEYSRTIETIADIDAIVVQGNEAGGHRASHEAPYWSKTESSTVEAWKPAEALLRDVLNAPAPAARKPPFILSAGGVMTPDQLVSRLAVTSSHGELGVAGVLLGTALLTAADAGTSQVHRNALLHPKVFDRVAATTSFSGRWAQGLHNANFSLSGPESPSNPFSSSSSGHILPFPFQNILTANRRKIVGAVCCKNENATGDQTEKGILPDSVELRRALAAAHFTSCWCGSGWKALENPSYQGSTSDILRSFTTALTS